MTWNHSFRSHWPWWRITCRGSDHCWRCCRLRHRPHADPRDPLEPFNRGVYKFNDAVDRAVLKPVATAYRDVVPSPVRTGVAQFLQQRQDGWSFVNNALQLKGQAAGSSLMRFRVNTFLGLGGVLDIATEMQIERSTEDFGQTLGYWGVGAGPYLCCPCWGRPPCATPLRCRWMDRAIWSPVSVMCPCATHSLAESGESALAFAGGLGHAGSGGA